MASLNIAPLAALLYLLGTGVLGTAANAATFTVTTSADEGVGTFRRAIEDANASADADNAIQFNIPTSDTGYDSTTSAIVIKPQSALPAVTKANTNIYGYQGFPIYKGVIIDGSEAGANANGLRLNADGGYLYYLVFRNFGAAGVRVESSDHNIYSGEYHNNGGAGVLIASGVGNNLSSNKIYANGKLGIDLVGGTENTDGVTANDADDSDTSANNLQNYPIIATVTYDAANSNTAIKGTVTSTPNTSLTIEAFRSPTADPSGFGEGEFTTNSTSVSTDGTGNAAFTVTTYERNIGHFYSVTATRSGSTGGTSEFSRAKAAVLAPSVVINSNDSGPGSLRDAISYANANTGTAISFNIPTSDPGYDATSGQFVIKPQSALPTLAANNSRIDGSTQANFDSDNDVNTSGDTNPNGPEIVIDGALAGAGVNGLTIAASTITVQYIEVRNFGGHGIQVQNGTNNILTAQNSIHDNGKLGIDLAGGSEDANGVTANDADDSDTGANNLQNFPIIDTAQYNPGTNITRIRGRLNSASNNSYQIDIFRSPAADPSGAGEGAVFVTSSSVYLDTNHNEGSFNVQINGDFRGQFFSATAYSYNSSSGTSEFSNARQSTLAPVVTNTADSGDGSLRAALTFANANPGSTIEFNIPTTDAGYNADARQFVIKPISALPTITSTQTTLDALSEYYFNYDAVNFTLPIALDGSQAGAGVNGLTIAATRVEVGNLAIYNFSGHGIQVSSGTDNNITQNGIHSNGKLGIDLAGGNEDANGVSTNDADDADTGANNLQNFPIITKAEYNGGSQQTTVIGTLTSRPSTTYYLEFFSSPAADASGYGEGAVYLGSANLNTDGSGQATFNRTFSGGGSGQAITATATEYSNNTGLRYNTSEFSQAKGIVAAPDIVTNSADSGDGSLRAALTFANANPGTAIKFNIPTTDAGFDATTRQFIIKPASALPVITGAGTTLDAATQYNFNFSNSNTPITLDGTLAGAGVNGLSIAASGILAQRLEIRNFGGHGIQISSGTDNCITQNSIHDNGKLGIDLAGGTETANGVTANDADDSDTSANNLQNAPVLAEPVFEVSNNRTTVTATLQSTPSTTFQIELFRSPAADASGFGEGKTYQTNTTVTTDANGLATRDFTFSGSFAGQTFTATALRYDNTTGITRYTDTSEFSNAVSLAGNNIVTNTADSGDGSLRAAIDFVNATPDTTVIFNIPVHVRTCIGAIHRDAAAIEAQLRLGINDGVSGRDGWQRALRLDDE